MIYTVLVTSTKDHSMAHAYLCEEHFEACMERVRASEGSEASGVPVTRTEGLECEVCDFSARHRNRIKVARTGARRHRQQQAR